MEGLSTYTCFCKQFQICAYACLCVCCDGGERCWMKLERWAGLWVLDTHRYSVWSLITIVLEDRTEWSTSWWWGAPEREDQGNLSSDLVLKRSHWDKTQLAVFFCLFICFLTKDWEGMPLKVNIYSSHLECMSAIQISFSPPETMVEKIKQNYL